VNRYDHIMKLVPMSCISRIDYACRFLEAEGLRFCVDFGLDNAESLMWERASDKSWGLQ